MATLEDLITKFDKAHRTRCDIRTKYYGDKKTEEYLARMADIDMKIKRLLAELLVEAKYFDTREGKRNAK